DQPLKVELASAVAVSVTEVPCPNACAHVAPQSIPGGFEVTAPSPTPALTTVSALSDSKVAVTECGTVIVNVQVPVPAQSPDQPVNVDPAAGLAVSVTDVPWAKECVHVAPQSMPVGVDVTEPVPLPAFAT